MEYQSYKTWCIWFILAYSLILTHTDRCCSFTPLVCEFRLDESSLHSHSSWGQAIWSSWGSHLWFSVKRVTTIYDGLKFATNILPPSCGDSRPFLQQRHQFKMLTSKFLQKHKWSLANVSILTLLDNITASMLVSILLIWSEENQSLLLLDVGFIFSFV